MIDSLTEWFIVQIKPPEKTEGEQLHECNCPAVQECESCPPCETTCPETPQCPPCEGGKTGGTDKVAIPLLKQYINGLLTHIIDKVQN